MWTKRGRRVDDSGEGPVCAAGRLGQEVCQHGVEQAYTHTAITNTCSAPGSIQGEHLQRASRMSAGCPVSVKLACQVRGRKLKCVHRSATETTMSSVTEGSIG